MLDFSITEHLLTGTGKRHELSFPNYNLRERSIVTYEPAIKDFENGSLIIDLKKFFHQNGVQVLSSHFTYNLVLKGIQRPLSEGEMEDVVEFCIDDLNKQIVAEIKRRFKLPDEYPYSIPMDSDGLIADITANGIENGKSA